MKSLSKILALFLVSLVLMVGCKDDADEITPTTSDFELLSDHLVNSSLDLPDVLSGWITGAPALEDVNTFISDNYIIDIRSAADFATSHIEGAVNSTLANILNEAANANGKPIVVACYTGQTAGHAVVALRLSGYPDAKVLKFGMSGWHSTLDRWTPNTGDMAIGHSNWTTVPTDATGTFTTPTLEAVGTDGASILAERVDLLISGGLRGVNNSDVLGTPTAYQINNFWDQADVAQYGCIDGALRIKPLSIANDEILNLDPAQTVVTYCWTGQTSSMITAYLYVLGYDSKSLKFGVNGMIYSDLESHKFSATSVVDLPVVTVD